MVVILISLLSIGLASAPAMAQTDGVDLTDKNTMALEDINIKIEPSDIPGTATNGADGQLRYQVELTGKIQNDNYPILYPVRVEYYDVTEHQGVISDADELLDGDLDGVTNLGADSTFLTPTQPDTFPPGTDTGPFENRQMAEIYNTTLNFEDLLEIDENEAVQKEVVAVLNSTRSVDQTLARSTDTITGPLPSGVSDGFVSKSADTDTPSSVSFVDNYRISEDRQNPQFGEDLAIPSPGYTDLRGQITSFNSMSRPLQGLSTVSGGQNGISFNTLTSSIPTGSPQTLVITYNITQGDEVTVNPINPAGQQVEQSTEYTLPDNAGDSPNCREITVDGTGANACIFYLDQGEIESINELGEMIAHYQSDERTEIGIGCQSLISGYLPVDKQACGVNPFGSGPGADQDPLLSLTIEGQAGDENDIDSEQWQVDEVAVPSRPDVDEEPHHLRSDVSGNIQESDYNGNVELLVYDDSQIEFNEDGRTIKSGEDPITTLDVGNFESGNWEQILNVGQAPTLEVTEYTAILCEEGDSCDVGERGNIDEDTVKFVPPQIDGELIINEPVTINPLPIEDATDSFITRTERVETIDDNFDSNTDWTSQGRIATDYDGTVTQIVTLRNRGEAQANTARANNLLQDAEDRLSDIGSNSWDYTVSVSQISSGEAYVPESKEPSDYNDNGFAFPGSNWRSAPTFDSREVQTGTESENFPLVTDSSFAAQVESQERWYPLRDQSGSRSSTEYVLDNVLRYEDPDNCLNCLPAESKEQAEQRLGQSIGGLTRVVETPNTDVWNKVDDEPLIRNGDEINASFYRRGQTVGNTLFYQNLGSSVPEDKIYRHRNSNKSNVQLYEWEYAPEILEVPFGKPTTEQTQRYVNNRYNIVYTFTSNIQSPSDLYAYEKQVEKPVIEYEKGHIAWLDISPSDSEEFYQYEVQYEGADNPVTVRWDEDIHGVAPHDRNAEALNEECDGSVTNLDGNNPVTLGPPDIVEENDDLVYADGRHGNGGDVVLQECTIDGEERIVRVGVEYTEPGSFSFDVDVTGLDADEGGEGSGINTVVPEGQDEDDRFEDGGPESSPNLDTIEPINEKVDFRVGIAAFQGTISSSTHHLDKEYEVTVTPADDIDAGSVTCGEFDGYRSQNNIEVTQTFLSGDSFRQEEQCIRQGFVEPGEAPSSFVLERKGYNFDTRDEEPNSDDLVYEEAFDIPAGAIQSCEAPLEEDDSGQCFAQTSAIDPDPSDGNDIINQINFGSADGGWSQVAAHNDTVPPIGNQCPLGYESSVDQDRSNDNYDLLLETTCSLSADLSIDLRSRLINLEYESVSSGKIEECSNIASSGEDRNHDGYSDRRPGDDGIEYCEKNDENDPGPSSFVLYEDTQDPVTQETERSYNNVPAGAFRGVSLSDDRVPSECAETRTEDDGSLVCDFDPNGDGDSEEIRYGVVEYGSWTSTSQRASDLVDQAQSRKAIWRGEAVIPVNDDQSTSTTEWNEPFTAVINPRDIGVSLEGLEDNTVEFTFELRETDTSEVVGTEQVEVKLCESTSVGSVDQLPRDVQGENECDDFDSVMTGYDDWQIGKAGQNANNGEVVEDLEEAVDDYASGDISSSGPQDYVIESVANDACPYTHEFPRDQQSLVENPDTYTYTIDADNSNQLSAEQDRIERAIYNELGGQYSVKGDPCSGSLADFGKPPTPIRESEDISVTFDKYSFTSGIDNHDRAGRDFTRIAGLSDLHQNTLNPVQSRWSQDDLGGAIRLGTPVLLDEGGSVGPGRSISPRQNEANDGLVAHYPFDHDPTEHITYTEISGGPFEDSETETTIPNHYVVQDVGLTETFQSPDGTETTWQYDLLEDDDTSSKGIFNSRIWYGSPCHRGPDGTRSSRGYIEGQVFSPDSLQPVNEDGPETNARHTSFEGCANVLVSEGAKEISEYDYVANPWGERYQNLPSHLRFRNSDLNNDIERLTPSVPEDQAAYLPVSTSYTGAGTDTYNNNGWESEYDVSGGQINDAYKSLEENYVEGRGVFGGNALRLNQDSWLMVTPPCYKNDDIGEDLDDVAISNVLGGGTADSSCQQSSDPDPGDTWRGGWADSYTDPENQLSFSSIHNRIEDDYTISFWINTEQAREGFSNEVSSSYQARNIAPIDTFYSTSKPVTNNYEVDSAEALMSTNQLSTLRVPQRIDISDIDNSELPGVDSDQSYTSPPAWDYPAHYNLRDTARACMNIDGLEIDRSSYPFPNINIDGILDDDERPIMCHIFEASDNENVDGSWDDLTSYDISDLEGELREPVFLEQFRREMINHRIEWENRYDWAPGSGVESADSGVASDDNFPEYGFNNQYITPRLSSNQCEFATQRGCYDDGRYIHGSGVPGGNYMSKTDEALGASGWQHVAISNTEDGLSIYINGEKENNLQASSDGTLQTNAIISDSQEIEVGKLHDDGVVSIGAMYQGAGYNFNPDAPGEEAGDYVPYIHSSIDTVMIDELRIYNESTADYTPFGESKVEAEVPELKPPERHGLHPEADLYTGEFVTDDAQSLGKDSSLSQELNDAPQELYTTWEAEVNATSEGPAAYEVEIIPCENDVGTANCAESASQTLSKSNVPDGLGDRADPGSIDDDFEFDFPSDRRLFRLADSLASNDNVEDQNSGRLLRSIIPPEEIGGGIAPENDGQTYEEIYEQSKDTSVDGIEETITFDRDAIADAEIERIDSFKFEFKLGTPFVDSTPVIRDVTLSPKNDPYQDCQGLARDHPGSEGLYGAEFRVNLIDQTARIHEAECDMTTAGGEWTKFAWLDQTNNGDFNKDIGGDPSGIFLEDRNRADCDLDEDYACFANADIDFQSVPRGEKPQILIKSIDEGEVVNWAAFELDEETHNVIENSLGQDDVPVAGEIEQIFDGDPDPVKDDSNPFDMSGPDTSSTVSVDGDNIVTEQFGSADRQLYPKCLHPFDSSAEFDDLRCVSHALSVPGGGIQDVATTRLSEYSQTSSGTSTKVDVLNAEVDFDDQKIDSLTCLGESTDRCEFYYRTGDASDPFSQDSQIRGDAVFDPDDYLGAQPQPLDGSNLPRGYSFSVEYETKITSLYSAYTGGAGTDWFVAIYESDDQGNLEDLVAETSASPSADNTDFVENNINNETLESGETYTIVQGKPENTANDGKPLGWSGPGFNMANLLGENPVGFFKPAAEGKTFRYDLTDQFDLEGSSSDPTEPTLDPTERAPRVGFDYKITDTEFVEAQGSVIDFEIDPETITSGSVDYSVTNTVTGNDVTSESSIISPIARTSLDVTDLDGTWSECDSGLLYAQASWTDSDGETYSDIESLEVNAEDDCPEWVRTDQELVRDQQQGSNYDTSASVRGYRIEPDKPIRVSSMELGIEFSATNGDTDTLRAWGAIYNASGDQPSNKLAQTDVFGPSETDGPGLETYQLQSDQYLAEGQQYIIAVGGEAEAGTQARTYTGRGRQYVLKGPEKNNLIPGAQYEDPNIDWNDIQNMNVVNNRALRWNTGVNSNTGESAASTPSYIEGQSPDETGLSRPPNFGLNYEYLENAP